MCGTGRSSSASRPSAPWLTVGSALQVQNGLLTKLAVEMRKENRAGLPPVAST